MRKIFLFFFLLLIPSVWAIEGDYGYGEYGYGVYSISNEFSGNYGEGDYGSGLYSSPVGVTVSQNDSLVIVPDTPLIVDMIDETDTEIEFTVNIPIIAGSVTVIKSLTPPQDSIPPTSKTTIGKYITIDVNNEIKDNLKYSVIGISYDDNEISGLQESTLRLYKWNYFEWIVFNGEGIGWVDITLNKVYANTTSFSTWGVFATPTSVSLPSEGKGGGSSGGGFTCNLKTNIEKDICENNICPRYLDVNNCSKKPALNHLCCVYYLTLIEDILIEEEIIDIELVEEEEIEDFVPVEKESIEKKNKLGFIFLISIVGIIIFIVLIIFILRKKQNQ